MSEVAPSVCRQEDFSFYWFCHHWRPPAAAAGPGLQGAALVCSPGLAAVWMDGWIRLTDACDIFILLFVFFLLLSIWIPAGFLLFLSSSSSLFSFFFFRPVHSENVLLMLLLTWFSLLLPVSTSANQTMPFCLFFVAFYMNVFFFKSHS